MLAAPQARVWPSPLPHHHLTTTGGGGGARYGYSSLAQILPTPQEKGEDGTESGHHGQAQLGLSQAPPLQVLTADEPPSLVKKKEHKTLSSASDWRKKDAGSGKTTSAPGGRAPQLVKTEPGLVPCQVQEVTTSSTKQDSTGGIPVGIAVARQRIQQSTPPPLTVLTCEERSTNQVTGWTGPTPHWHYPVSEKMQKSGKERLGLKTSKASLHKLPVVRCVLEIVVIHLELEDGEVEAGCWGDLEVSWGWMPLGTAEALRLPSVGGRLPVDQSFYLDLPHPDNTVLDNIVSTPLFFSLTTRTELKPKESTSKGKISGQKDSTTFLGSDKSEIFKNRVKIVGQGNLDLLPLLMGKEGKLEETVYLERPGHIDTLFFKRSRTEQPRIFVKVIDVGRTLSKFPMHNLLWVTVESVFNPGDSYLDDEAQYTAIFPLPRQEIEVNTSSKQSPNHESRRHFRKTKLDGKNVLDSSRKEAPGDEFSETDVLTSDQSDHETDGELRLDSAKGKKKADANPRLSLVQRTPLDQYSRRLLDFKLLEFHRGLWKEEPEFDLRKKWASLASITGGPSKQQELVPHDSGSLISKCKLNIKKKLLSETEPKIVWNMCRPYWLDKEEEQSMIHRIYKYGVWPVEIVVKPGLVSDESKRERKTEKEQEGKSYIAWLDLSTLLLPGNDRVRVAGQLQIFDPVEGEHLWGLETTFAGRPVDSETLASMSEKTKSQKGGGKKKGKGETKLDSTKKMENREEETTSEASFSPQDSEEDPSSRGELLLDSAVASDKKKHGPENQELKELNEKYTALEQEYSALKAKYESLKTLVLTQEEDQMEKSPSEERKAGGETGGISSWEEELILGKESLRRWTALQAKQILLKRYTFAMMRKKAMEDLLLSGQGKLSSAKGPTMIVVEIKLMNPLIPRMPFEKVEASLKEFLPPSSTTKLTAKKRFTNVGLQSCLKNLIPLISKEYHDFLRIESRGGKSQCNVHSFYEYLEKSTAQQEVSKTLKEALSAFTLDTIGVRLSAQEKMATRNKDYINWLYCKLSSEIQDVINCQSDEQDDFAPKDFNSEYASLSNHNLFFYAAEAVEEGDIERAKLFLKNTMIGDGKNNPENWIYMTVLSLRLGDFPRAMECVREALAADVKHREALVIYGVLLTVAGKFDEAEKLLSALVEFHPTFPEGWFIIHAFYLLIEKKVSADAAFATGLRCLSEEGHEKADMLPQLVWDNTMNSGNEAVFLNTATYLLSLNLCEMAEVCLAQDLEENDCRSERLSYLLAVAHHLQGRYFESCHHLVTSILNTPQPSSHLWLLFGDNKWQLGEKKEAIRLYFESFTTKDPPKHFRIAYIRCGYYFLDLDKLELAKEVFLKAVSLQGTPLGWLGLGMAYFKLGNLDDAELALREANLLDNKQPLTWDYLGYVCKARGVDGSLPLQVPPLQLGRDPITGHLVLLPNPPPTISGDALGRAVVWGNAGGGPAGGNTGPAPPPLVVPGGPQPVLLDRLVLAAPGQQTSSPLSCLSPAISHHHHHHHQEKRRSTTTDHLTAIHGTLSASRGGGGLTVGLFPPAPQNQAPFLMMPFSQQNNSLLLSTHLTEHNLNTMVVTNHQLSESALLSPLEVITNHPVDGFSTGGMIQQLPPSVVISHTETNSFVRSDINAVYPGAPGGAGAPLQPPAPPVPAQPSGPCVIQEQQVLIKEEAPSCEQPSDDEVVEEETKTEVMDASNQTESPGEESETEEMKTEAAVPEPLPVSDGEAGEAAVVEPTPAEASPPPPPAITREPEPDMSGLDLLCCVAYQSESTEPRRSPPRPIAPVQASPQSKMQLEEERSWEEDPESIAASGLSLLYTVASLQLGAAAAEGTPAPSGSEKEPGRAGYEMEPTLSDKDEEISNFDDEEEYEGSDSSYKSSSTHISSKGEWFTLTSSQNSSDGMKIKIKRKPGRPKKKQSKKKRVKAPLSVRSEPAPPVLHPCLEASSEKKSPIRSPPILTPHKRKLSHDSQESDVESRCSSSGGQPPPLSPAALRDPPEVSPKKRKVGRPPKKKSDEAPRPAPSPPPPVHKIKPKLKAEAKVKDWCDDEDLDLSPGKENEIEPKLPRSPIWQSPSKPVVKHPSSPRKPVSKPLERKDEDISKTVFTSPKTELINSETTGMTDKPLPVPNIKKSVKNSVALDICDKSSNLNEKTLNLKDDLPIPPVINRKTPISNKTAPVVEEASCKKPESEKSLVPAESNLKSPIIDLKPSVTSTTKEKVTISSPIALKLPVSAEVKSPVVNSVKPIVSPVAKAPQSQVSKVLQPQVSKTPQPQVSKTPQPQVSKSPQPQASKTPQPQVSKTPQPQVSKAPKLVSPPVNKKKSPQRSAGSPTHSVKRAKSSDGRKAQSSPSKQLPLPNSTSVLNSVAPSKIPDCKLSEKDLKSLPCRILTISDGQFYRGEVVKIVAPDIYEVLIYKERCRKPQILCRDEILSSSVLEVHCPEKIFLPAGTRVCAYWSQQYSCYYPGSVVSDTLDSQVPIDFDDGDNGSIDRTSIRFLPQDYPTVESPPNPLVGKRKRYNSSASSDGNKTNNDVNGDTSLNSSEKSLNENSEETTKHLKEDKPSEENDRMSDSEESVNSESDTKEAIRTVLEGFFRSEEKARERERQMQNERVERPHKCHKHHKHRDGSTTKPHKCKHSKHHRSHKHKHNHDNSSGNRSHSSDVESIESKETKPLDKKDEKTTVETAKDVGKKKKKEEWYWVGEGVKRGRALGPRGKGLKIFYKGIQRGREKINIGDCAVFVSLGRRDRPFIGQIEQFWQCHMKKNMQVKISWFYHPEETIGCPDKLPYPGGVFKSSHNDLNDVQTISHKCEVLPLTDFVKRMKKKPDFLENVYEVNDTYYLAGFYDPTNITLTLDDQVSKALEEEKNETKVAA